MGSRLIVVYENEKTKEKKRERKQEEGELNEEE